MSLRPPGNPQETEENHAPHRGNPQKTWGGQGGQRADNSVIATADKGGQPETRRGHRADNGGQRGLSGSGQADSAPIRGALSALLVRPPSAPSGPVRPALEDKRRGDPSAARCSPQRVAEAIARLSAGGDTWHAPLLRAAGQGALRLLFVPRNGRVPLRELDAAVARPTVLVLCGDDETGPAPPEAWPQHKRMLRWARAVVIHGAGGLPEHYEMALDGALLHRRLLLVECDSQSLGAWVEAVRRFAPCAAALAIAPSEGEHPVLATRRH